MTGVAAGQEHARSLELSPTRRAAVLAAPVVVPVTMTALFRVLTGRLSPRLAYNAGFAVYWLGWCTAFPLLIVGWRRAAAVLAGGRWPRHGETVALALPAAGAIAAELQNWYGSRHSGCDLRRSARMRFAGVAWRTCLRLCTLTVT
jgi:hypothetical protein